MADNDVQSEYDVGNQTRGNKQPHGDEEGIDKMKKLLYILPTEIAL